MVFDLYKYLVGVSLCQMIEMQNWSEMTRASSQSSEVSRQDRKFHKQLENSMQCAKDIERALWIHEFILSEKQTILPLNIDIQVQIWKSGIQWVVGKQSQICRM